jgi:hypothetical protein
MPLVIHLALSVSWPASRTYISECYTGAYSWLLHVMHIWYQWLESEKPVTSTSNLTDNSMGHSLYLPKQYLMPCQSHQQSKMRHSILSHSWLGYNWRMKAATDDFHHHCAMQVKRDDHTFSSKNCVETKVHSAKTKTWASFHIPRKLHHSKTNE